MIQHVQDVAWDVTVALAGHEGLAPEADMSLDIASRVLRDNEGEVLLQIVVAGLS